LLTSGTAARLRHSGASAATSSAFRRCYLFRTAYGRLVDRWLPLSDRPLWADHHHLDIERAHLVPQIETPGIEIDL
jgi:hypothetical protein